MNNYPASIVPVNHVAPVPRRIRAYLGAEKVLDTTRALYVWEWPHYPQYYIPLDDVRRDLLVSEGHAQRTGRGLAELHGLTVGELHRPRAARLIADSAIDGLKGTVRFEWAAAVMVFETGLPVRYYVNRTDVRFEHLVPSDTVTSCPYKGMTSSYWSVRAGGAVHKDLAWAYDFPTRQLLPIAGLVAFYNEMVDTYLDGELLDRPQTHFSRTGRDGS